MEKNTLPQKCEAPPCWYLRLVCKSYPYLLAKRRQIKNKITFVETRPESVDRKLSTFANTIIAVHKPSRRSFSAVDKEKPREAFVNFLHMKDTQLEQNNYIVNIQRCLSCHIILLSKRSKYLHLWNFEATIIYCNGFLNNVELLLKRFNSLKYQIYASCIAQEETQELENSRCKLPEIVKETKIFDLDIMYDMIFRGVIKIISLNSSIKFFQLAKKRSFRTVITWVTPNIRYIADLLNSYRTTKKTFKTNIYLIVNLIMVDESWLPESFNYSLRSGFKNQLEYPQAVLDILVEMTQNSNFFPRSFFGGKEPGNIGTKKNKNKAIKAIKVNAFLAIYERVSGREIALEENCLPDNCPLEIAPYAGQLPQTIAPWVIAPGLLLPNNNPKDIIPGNIPWKLPSRKIAFRMICRLHNCLSGKLSRGKLPPRKIVPKINYAEIFLLQEPEILVL